MERIIITIENGMVAHVHSSVMADVDILDYDEPLETLDAEQRFSFLQNERNDFEDLEF